LASFEAKEVIEVDDELQALFKEHYRDLVFLYSPIDPYTPIHFVDDLKKMIPDGNIYMTDPHIAHAFVLKNAEEVAKKLVDIINHNGVTD